MALRYDLTAPLARFVAQNPEGLPKPFRLETSEVWISRDAQTGDIILRPKPSEAERQAQLADLLALIDHNTDRTDFLPPRSPEPPRNPLV
jgi:hypothetical protein